MITIETYYLIDYENVGREGLTGCSKLLKNDHIIIFFTQNAKKIDMSDIANHGEAQLDMIEVPAGKQSLDIHIGSYLGYLAGMNSKCKVVIVSKDCDYDNVIQFWNKKIGIEASRTSVIMKAQNVSKKQTGKETIQKKSEGNEKQRLNNEIMKIIGKAGYDNETIGYVTSLVVKNYGVQKNKQQIYRTIVSKYGEKKGLDVYNRIKKHI